jgi:hypothetical protein
MGDVAEIVADCLRRGIGSHELRKVLNKRAVRKAGESEHQSFAKSYVGPEARVEGDLLFRVLKELEQVEKLGDGGGFKPTFRFESSLETGPPRVTPVRSDEASRSNAGSFTSEPRVLQPDGSYDPLQSWNDAIDEIVRTQGLSRSDAILEAMKIPAARQHLTAAKEMKFTKAVHGWDGMPDRPMSDDHLDDEEDEDSLDRENKRKPRVKKSLLAMAMARRRQQGGGGGVPR